MGAGMVGRIDVTFLSVPNPTGSLTEPSLAMVEEKKHFASSRKQRWFGIS
jgi:sulfide:quinone oxidoreductase